MLGSFEHIGPAFGMSETPLRTERAPLLGEHNQEIYCGRLGLKAQELSALRERGII